MDAALYSLLRRVSEVDRTLGVCADLKRPSTRGIEERATRDYILVHTYLETTLEVQRQIGKFGRDPQAISQSMGRQSAKVRILLTA